MPNGLPRTRSDRSLAPVLGERAARVLAGAPVRGLRAAAQEAACEQEHEQPDGAAPGPGRTRWM